MNSWVLDSLKFCAGSARGECGRSGLFVSEICLGAMIFGGDENAGMWKAIGMMQQDEMARLDKVSALPPKYPGWMLERPAGYRKR